MSLFIFKKKHLSLSFFMVGFSFSAWSLPVPSTEPASLTFAQVVKKTAPAVVNLLVLQVIDTDFVHPFMNDPDFQFFFEFGILGLPSPQRQRHLERSLGSGVLVDPTGIIVTCEHVVRHAKAIRIELNDNRRYEAEIVIADPENDLAVLKVKNLPAGRTLPFVELGDSDRSEVGDALLVIGNAFGMKQTVTAGINSASNKVIGEEKLVIQTDASVNPGNSGGAVLRETKLIAIPNAIYSKTGASHGINFAIPVVFAKALINAAKNGKKFVRPWYGLKTQDVTQELAESLKLPYVQGALITSVHPKSPLKGFLHPSDIVLELNGLPVTSAKYLELRLKAFEVPEKLTLKVGRYEAGQNSEREIVFTTIESPDDEDNRRLTLSAPLEGVVIANNSVDLAKKYHADSEVEGVIVVQTKPQKAPKFPFGPQGFVPFAASVSALLKPGDIILKINNKRVRKVEDLPETLQPKAPFSLILRRGKRDIRIS